MYGRIMVLLAATLFFTVTATVGVSSARASVITCDAYPSQSYLCAPGDGSSGDLVAAGSNFGYDNTSDASYGWDASDSGYSLASLYSTQGRCDQRVSVRNYTPLWLQGHADSTCTVTVSSLSITACLMRSTLGPVIHFAFVACRAVKVLNTKYRGVYLGHVCRGNGTYLWRMESITYIGWPSGLQTSGVTVSGAGAYPCY
jgi:hypothetical protein